MAEGRLAMAQGMGVEGGHVCHEKYRITPRKESHNTLKSLVGVETQTNGTTTHIRTKLAPRQFYVVHNSTPNIYICTLLPYNA